MVGWMYACVSLEISVRWRVADRAGEVFRGALGEDIGWHLQVAAMMFLEWRLCRRP